MDKLTWSRSMVATLGLGIIGASRKGWMDTPMVPPQRSFSRSTPQARYSSV
jgi:hypothetical protein